MDTESAAVVKAGHRPLKRPLQRRQGNRRNPDTVWIPAVCQGDSGHVSPITPSAMTLLWKCRRHRSHWSHGLRTDNGSRNHYRGEGPWD